jgi:hypothetical protein
MTKVWNQSIKTFNMEFTAGFLFPGYQLPARVLFAWADFVAQAVLLPPLVLPPLCAWLLAREEHQTDAARLALRTRLAPQDFYFLTTPAEADAVFSQLAMRAPHSFSLPHLYAVALASGRLSADVATAVVLHAAHGASVDSAAGWPVAAMRAVCNAVYGRLVADLECAICMEAILKQDMFLQCQHVFHAHCLARWAQATCPLCRQATVRVVPCDPFLMLPQRAVDDGPSAIDAPHTGFNFNYVFGDFISYSQHQQLTFVAMDTWNWNFDMGNIFSFLDVRLVAQQSGVSNEAAEEALRDADGDVVTAIMSFF